MPIEISWDNDPHNLIIMHFVDTYTWLELDTVIDQTYAMLNSVPHQVDIIAVLDPKLKAPVGGNMIARFRKMLNYMPNNLGVYINVGRGNAFSRAIANTVLKIYPLKFDVRSAGSVEEAREMLAERRPI